LNDETHQGQSRSKVDLFQQGMFITHPVREIISVIAKHLENPMEEANTHMGL
jgi:hypothetical protein